MQQETRNNTATDANENATTVNRNATPGGPVIIQSWI